MIDLLHHTVLVLRDEVTLEDIQNNEKNIGEVVSIAEYSAELIAFLLQNISGLYDTLKENELNRLADVVVILMINEYFN